MYLKSLILVHPQNVTVLIFSIFPLLYVGIPSSIKQPNIVGSRPKVSKDTLRDGIQ